MKGLLYKILFKLRMWLLDLLHGEPKGYSAEVGDMYLELLCSQRKQITVLDDTIALYKNAIREICRRSENTYYDWCCDVCACNCDKRNGWCNDFEPVRYEK